MKKIFDFFQFILILHLFFACNEHSIQKSGFKYSPENLKEDMRFLKKKILTKQPVIHNYGWKEDFTAKWDSTYSCIHNPMYYWFVRG